MAAGPYTILQELTEHPDRLESALSAPGLDSPLMPFDDYIKLYQRTTTPADLAPLYTHFGNATVEELRGIYHDYLVDGGDYDYWARHRGNITYVLNRLNVHA